MLEQPTQQQKDELDTCIATAQEVVSFERRLQEIKNLHQFHPKQYIEQLKTEQANIERYLPKMREDLGRYKMNVLMRGQPHH